MFGMGLMEILIIAGVLAVGVSIAILAVVVVALAGSAGKKRE